MHGGDEAEEMRGEEKKKRKRQRREGENEGMRREGGEWKKEEVAGCCLPRARARGGS